MNNVASNGVGGLDNQELKGLLGVDDVTPYISGPGHKEQQETKHDLVDEIRMHEGDDTFL